MEINEAKTRLLSDLQTKHSGILGGGIRKREGKPFIVVYISRPDQENVVPHIFQGNRVVTEVKKLARAFQVS